MAAIRLSRFDVILELQYVGEIEERSKVKYSIYALDRETAIARAGLRAGRFLKQAEIVAVSTPEIPKHKDIITS